MGEAEAESEAAGGLVDVTGRGEVAATGLLSGAMKKDWREVRKLRMGAVVGCCLHEVGMGRDGGPVPTRPRRPSMAWW